MEWNQIKRKIVFQKTENVSGQVFLLSKEIITTNGRKVGYLIIYIDAISNAILFINTPTMPGTKMIVRQLRPQVLRLFLVISIFTARIRRVGEGTVFS